MQNFVNFYTPTIKTNSAFYIPGGDAKVSFVDVRDIAAVAAKVLTEHDESETRHFDKAYNITGPEALSYYQAAEILSKTVGKKINYVNIPEADARRGMKDMGMNEWFINIALELFDNYRKGYASQVSDAVESITGNFPWVQVEEGIYARDGGLLSNTPFGEVIDALPVIDKRLFFVENYARRIDRLPGNLTEVYHRIRDIQFSDKSQHSIKMSKAVTRYLKYTQVSYSIIIIPLAFTPPNKTCSSSLIPWSLM
jgi:hypothetical protein